MAETIGRAFGANKTVGQKIYAIGLNRCGKLLSTSENMTGMTGEKLGLRTTNRPGNIQANYFDRVAHLYRLLGKLGMP